MVQNYRYTGMHPEEAAFSLCQTLICDWIDNRQMNTNPAPDLVEGCEVVQ